MGSPIVLPLMVWLKTSKQDSSQMTGFQIQLLEFLKKFDAFCQEQHLEYCLFWGTLIGCIREGGFIPWDDDVDVAMDRDNFEKLKRLAREGKLPPQFEFEDSLFLKGCRIPKVRYKGVAIHDRNGGTGIFIDIFPFDRFTAIDVQILKIAATGLHVRDYRRKISNKLVRSVYTPLSIIPYLLFVLVRSVYSHRELKNGKYIGNSPVTNSEYFFNVSDFYPFSRKQFEDSAFPVPKGFDAILKEVYGNYLIPVDYKNKHY